MKNNTNLSDLNNETVINTWLQHLEHLSILHVVANVLQDISVGNDAKGTEDDPDRDNNLDVRYSGFHHVSQLGRG